MVRCNKSIHRFTSISLISNSSYFHFQGAAAHPTQLFNSSLQTNRYCSAKPYCCQGQWWVHSRSRKQGTSRFPSVCRNTWQTTAPHLCRGGGPKNCCREPGGISWVTSLQHGLNPSPLLPLDHGSGGPFAAPAEGCGSSWNWLIFAGQIKITLNIVFKFHAPPAEVPFLSEQWWKPLGQAALLSTQCSLPSNTRGRKRVKIKGALDGKPNKLSLLTESPWYDKSTSNMF